MYKKTLIRIQNKVRVGNYYFRDHAEDEMGLDDFVTEDVVQGILNGKIVQRQKDHQTGEWKYVIHGNSTLQTKRIGIVVKEKFDVVIITVFWKV